MRGEEGIGSGERCRDANRNKREPRVRKGFCEGEGGEGEGGGGGGGRARKGKGAEGTGRASRREGGRGGGGRGGGEEGGAGTTVATDCERASERTDGRVRECGGPARRYREQAIRCPARRCANRTSACGMQLMGARRQSGAVLLAGRLAGRLAGWLAGWLLAAGCSARRFPCWAGRGAARGWWAVCICICS